MKPFLIAISLSLAAASATSQPLSLLDALATARRERGDVRAADLALQAARLEGRSLAAYPAVTVGAGQSTRADLGATDQDLFVTVPLDAFGRTAAGERLGSSVVMIAQAERASTLLGVQTEVMIAYFEAVASARLAEAARELAALSESLFRATERRFEEGNVPETQVKRAGIERDRAKQAAEFRSAELAAALLRLAGAIGLAAWDREIDLAATLPKPETDVSRRPDVMVFRARALQAKAEASIAARDGLPELELTGLRSPWRENPAQSGLRLQLTWRLLDFGRTANQRASAQARARAAEEAVMGALRQAEAELAAVDRQIAAGEARVAAYESIRSATIDLLQKTQSGFAQGYGTLLEVLEAGRALREIEQELAEARLALDLSVVAKYAASGTLIEVAP